MHKVYSRFIQVSHGPFQLRVLAERLVICDVPTDRQQKL